MIASFNDISGGLNASSHIFILSAVLLN